MAYLIKINCNGPIPHLNDMDLDKLLQPATVVRGAQSAHLHSELPEKLVQKCRFCTEGRVVITREIIQDHLRK